MPIIIQRLKVNNEHFIIAEIDIKNQHHWDLVISRINRLLLSNVQNLLENKEIVIPGLSLKENCLYNNDIFYKFLIIKGSLTYSKSYKDYINAINCQTNDSIVFPKC